jgi:hypothetical protein
MPVTLSSFFCLTDGVQFRRLAEIRRKIDGINSQRSRHRSAALTCLGRYP